MKELVEVIAKSLVENPDEVGQDESGIVPVAVCAAQAVALGKLYGCMEHGNWRLSVQQRDHYGGGHGIVHICQLSGGLSAGTPSVQVEEVVDLSDSWRPDAGAPVFGHLPF